MNNGLPTTIPELAKEMRDGFGKVDDRLNKVEINLELINEKLLSPVERLELNRRLAK